MVLVMVVLGVWASAAAAGQVWYEYYKDGDVPGTVWVQVNMDPVDYAPCDECVLPDWSQVHVSPAPVWPTSPPYTGGSIQYDATGAFVRGDGYSRILILELGTTYQVSDMTTRRTALAWDVLQDGTHECTGVTGCTYEVADYAPFTIDPQTVPADDKSMSDIKLQYQK